MTKTTSTLFLRGLMVLVPTSTTILILVLLFNTLDNLIGDYLINPFPGLGLIVLLLIVMLVGIIADHVIGKQILDKLEQRLEQIPLVQSIYLTLKGMTDLLNYRTRFTDRAVVAFPFPRNGLWAIGFVMGIAPGSIQVSTSFKLHMVFVPTAIHPFTGYLALIPDYAIVPLNLPPEEAMKMEFSAGFYKPPSGWLQPPQSLP
ncbi:MAG: DUF502 domain-containing protein [Nitrospira sp.]|nr:DUF502 domain-containing protein [Nitrospira sp.]